MSGQADSLFDLTMTRADHAYRGPQKKGGMRFYADLLKSCGYKLPIVGRFYICVAATEEQVMDVLRGVENAQPRP